MHNAISHLYAQRFDVVGSVGATRKVRQVELNLVPTVIEPHRHRADERLDARRALVVAGSETALHVLVIQHLSRMQTDNLLILLLLLTRYTTAIFVKVITQIITEIFFEPKMSQDNGTFSERFSSRLSVMQHAIADWPGLVDL